MKIAYFDCFAGASGDMILGALLDAGMDLDHLKHELAKLKLTGYTIQSKKSDKGGISATKFDVRVTHDHHHRNLKDIVQIIDKSRLTDLVKDISKKIFTRLAHAEAKVHRVSVNKIHFHEVGAVDAIVDIVGAVIGFQALGIDEIQASRLHLGSGTVECAHGILPVPPPAVAELVKGIPVYSTAVEGELVTPTGAAILTTLCKHFGPIPSMQIEKTGYGAGSKSLSIPNVLRVLIGESESGENENTVQLIETNIDDMNPQFYEHVMELLFEAGAKDVFLTPVIMKKNRPGIVLSVIALPDTVDGLTELLFRETTTLGVRISEVKKRMVLKREIVTVQTRWGKVRVKVRSFDGSKQSAMPEYDDAKRIAAKFRLPIGEVVESIRKEAEKRLDSEAKA